MVVGSAVVVVSVNDNLDDVVLLQLKPCIGRGPSDYVGVEVVQPSFTSGNSKDACSTIVSTMQGKENKFADAFFNFLTCHSTSQDKALTPWTDRHL